jgi:extracellular factor (EF) 3-hydroxypalmitic acid methyl ester biosynthesis protein
MSEDDAVSGFSQSVTCQTRRGAFLRGHALELSADRIRFESVDPFADIRASDSVQELRVLMDGRVAYEGEGVVSRLFPMPGGYVCEVAVSKPWQDWIRTSPVAQDPSVRYLAAWERFRRLEPAFVQAVVNLYTYLQTLQVSLESDALRIRLAPEVEREAMRRAKVREAAPHVVEAIHRLYEQFEHAAESIPPGRQGEHKIFAQRLVHPFILQSPFVHRTFYKPLGYPGDYEMVDMMFRDPDEGATLLGRLVNLYALQLPPILSHRSRIQYLFDLLSSESLRVQGTGRPVRVFSMGAGPAREVQRYVREFPRCRLAEFTLMDADPRTIEHLGQVFSGHGREGGKRPVIRVQSKSILAFLKGIKRSAASGDAGPYDVVYCAGLFDYLPDGLCTAALEAFYKILAPGGIVVVTNVDDNPSRYEMEMFLEWFVIPRTSEQMRQLLPDSIPREQARLISDESAGANLFMEVRKPS